MSETTEADWRDEPSWRLAEWSRDCFSEPPTKPTPDAELAQPPIWASEIRNRKIVASWSRPSSRNV